MPINIFNLLDPDKRAKELHSKIKHTHTQSKTTTAVLNTEEGKVLVGSSEKSLRKEIREALEKHEIEAFGEGHAEETVIQNAIGLGLTGIEIGASRPICLDCEYIINENNIIAKTEFSGKPSQKRKK
jgi:hypothetical protein